MSNMSSQKFSEAELRLSIADILIESILTFMEKDEDGSDESVEWLVGEMLNSIGMKIHGQSDSGDIEVTLALGTPINIFI